MTMQESARTQLGAVIKFQRESFGKDLRTVSRMCGASIADIESWEAAVKLYRTDRVRRIKAKHRRDGLKALQLCINGAKHGPATHGRRCKSCAETHRKSA